MNVQEIKATVEKKKAMLEAPENAWPLPPDVATWETADEAALKAETKELLAHAAAQDAAREKAAARSAEIEKELAALKEEAAKLEAEVAAEEKHLGDAMDRADELTAVTAGAAATALVAGPGGEETQALDLDRAPRPLTWLSPWHTDRGTLTMAHGPWHTDHGTLTMAHGPWHTVS